MNQISGSQKTIGIEQAVFGHGSVEAPPAVKRARHAVSSGLSFIQTAVENITSNRPDYQGALRLHTFGIQKLRDALIELDILINQPNLPPLVQIKRDHEAE